jgi:putative addiction module component (TIGR02574 family)
VATFNEVFNAAESLPIDDRIRLVDAIWDTIQDSPRDQRPAPSEEWIAECQRRSAAYDAGEISASPWPEALARAERKAGLDG